MTRLVGVTATREPLTTPQLNWLWSRLIDYHQPHAQLHFGDCVNGDAAAFWMATMLDYVTVSHPPDRDDSRRAHLVADVEMSPAPYLTRNRNIVNLCSVLIAVPHEPEVPRSGTWSTVRYARRVGCPIRNWWYERNTNYGVE